MDTGQLDRICNSFRARLRLLVAQAGLARAVTLAVGLLGLVLALDWWVHLGSVLRLAVLAGYAGVLAAVLWWTMVRPLRRQWTDTEILSYVDATADRAGGMLLDLYELTHAADRIQEVADSPTGQALADAAADNLRSLADRVELAHTLRRRNVSRWLGLAGGLLAVLLAVGLVPASRPYLAIGCTRFFNPFSTVRWPHLTTVAVYRVNPDTGQREAMPPKGCMVPALESFRLEADVTGRLPADVTLFFRGKAANRWDEVHLPVPAGGRVAYTFENVRDPLKFYIFGGDYETETFEVGVIPRPYIRRITAKYRFPLYAGLPDREEHTGQLAGLEGTTVEVTFESSMKLKKAMLVMEPADSPATTRSESTVEELPLLTASTFRKTFVLTQNCTYGIELHEEHGIREARPERFEIRVSPDNPPTAELLSPGRDLLETNRSRLEVAGRATDDFGLKKVELVYQVNNGPPTVLSDRITGPIPQAGKRSEVRFTWPIRKSDLPETGTLSMFLRVEDVNPTGRGKVESAKAQVRLVKPNDFLLAALDSPTAKGLIGEARLAWRNQLDAYQYGLGFLKEGTGKEDDALWRQMQDSQDRAFLAGKAMKQHMRALTELYERNQMAQEFLAGRLAPIADLINRLVDKEHAAVEDGLRAARPKTATDAAPQRLVALRTDSLKKFADNQKMAVLILERALGKLYDWRDLQTATVTTKLLIEQQDDVIKLTEDIAPKTIGLEIYDLSDKDQEKLLTLGKQQRAIYDTESGLEKQLDDQIYKARLQRRTDVLMPLYAAFKHLRDNRVNDHLKQAAQMIENNQPSQITDNQRAVVRTLRTVETGLALAGQKVDPDEPLTLAMAINPDIDAEKVEVAVGPTATQPEGPEGPPSLPPLRPPPPPPGTRLAEGIRLARELQDNVRARTTYLFNNSTSAEMPRFVALKLLMLAERQDEALAGLDVAVKEAGEAGSTPVKEALAGLGEEFGQFQRLLGSKDISECCQKAQGDSMATLDDLLELVSWEQRVEDVTAENKRQQGVDAFGRQYFLRDQALDVVVGMINEAGYGRLLQRDVLRKVERFIKFPTKGGLINELEGTNRSRAAAAQRKAAAQVDGAVARLATLSAEVNERVSQAGVGELAGLKLGGFADPIGAGKTDDALLASLRAAEQALGAVVPNLVDLLEERVKPPPPPVVVATTQPIRREDFEKEWSRPVLAEKLKGDDSLSPELRARMIRALGKEFPQKYRDLLAAYYASFVQQEKKPE